MRARRLLILASIIGLSWPCSAQGPESRTWRRTVFGLDLSFQYPVRFAERVEAANEYSYRETLLLQGETLPTWRESIGVESFDHYRKMASLYSPERKLVDIERVYHKTCDGAVDMVPLPTEGLGVKRAAAKVFRCTPHAFTEPVEAILHLAISGKGGIYVIVWGERSARPSDRPPPAIDAAVWTARLRSLAPVSLCEEGSAPRCF